MKDHLTPAELVVLANEVAQRWPSAVLEKNPVGNLSVMLDDEWIAWLDLRTGEVNVVAAAFAGREAKSTSSSPPTPPQH